MLTVAVIALIWNGAQSLNNGVARTPPMGLYCHIHSSINVRIQIHLILLFSRLEYLEFVSS